jgi:hypothetical protein
VSLAALAGEKYRDRTRFARSSSKKHPSAADLGTGDQAALGARPDFFGMHMEERGSLFQIQRVHSVEFGISGLSFREPQDGRPCG